MDVKCPQCGRIYDLPETKISKSLKCICKFTFRYSSSSQQNSPSKQVEKKPSAIQTSSTQAQNESLDEASLSGDMSDGEIDNFLSNLRESHKELKTQESLRDESTPSVELPRHEIEIDINKGATENAEALFEETSESRFEAPPPAPTHQAAASPIEDTYASVNLKPAFHEQILNFAKSRAGALSLVSLGLVGLVSLSLYLVLSSKEEEVQHDPFLAELLEGEETAALPVIETHEPETPPISKTQPQKNKRSKPKQNSQDRSPSPKLSLESLSKNANYEEIWEWGKAPGNLRNAEDKAHYYEAGLLLDSHNRSQKTQIGTDIQNELKKSQNSSLHRSEALYFIESGNAVTAVKQLKNLQLTRSRDPLVFAYLGLAYQRINRPQLALSAYTQALTIDGNFPWALAEAAQIAGQTDQRDLAIDLSSRLIKLESDYKAKAYVQRAKTYSSLKQYSRAETDLNAAIKIEDSYEARTLLAQTLIKRNPSSASKHFAKAVELSRGSTERRNAYFGLGQAQCQAKAYDQAPSSFYKAYQEDRNFLAALEEKAVCEMKMGNPSKAARTYQSILKTRPQDHSIWLSYGSSLRFTKKYKPAIAAVKRSLELKDSDAGHYELALIYLSMNRRSEAAYHAKRAYRMNPKNKLAQKLSASLK